MTTTTYLEPNQVPAVLRGSYTGTKFRAIVAESVTVPSHAGLWDGGSRDTYELIDMATGESVPASDNVSAPWDPRKDRKIELRPGYCVRQHTIFCGKDLGLRFYVHPDNAAKLLPPPPAPLTAHEKIVLEATCTLKASYNGQDRYDMSRPPSWAIDKRAEFPTRAQWNDAKATLIARGYLNKAGAVTVAGRNARGG